MKIIMYHYVRPVDPEMPYFKHLTPEQFSAQLDYFEQTEGFLSRDAFIASVVEKKPRKGVVLTFDDGLRDHYDYVFPELQRRGLWGIFYAMGGSYIRREMVLPHKIHLLIGKFGGQAIAEAMPPISTIDLPYSGRKEFNTEPYKRQDNDAATMWVKRTLNFAMKRSIANCGVDDLMDSFGVKSRHQDWYLTKDMMAEMTMAGHVIGGHTVTHPVMSTLTDRQLNDEVRSPKCGEKQAFETFAYPYGGAHTYDDRVLEYFDRRYFCAMDVNPRDVDEDDLIDRLTLPRYDCNLFPPVRTA